MALSRQQSEFTYLSSSGGVSYYFDIVVDAQGLLTVQNIRSPQQATTCSTEIPSSIMSDISKAMEMTQQLVSETTVDSGILTFTGQTEQPVIILAGALNNTNYRVVYTTSDGTILVTESKTLTGFNAVVGYAYGTVTNPKTVNYAILVKTQQASVTGGLLTFTPADAGVKTVSFSPAFTTEDYRVILSNEGFFSSSVMNKTKNGFTVGLGYTVPTGETAIVGYDVFV